MQTLSALLVLLFPLGVIAAGLKDLTSYTIPNRLSAGVALAFAPAALLAGLSPAAAGLCLLVGLAGLVVGVVLFALRVVGGGDAKLMAACLLWLGPAAALNFLVWTAVAGGGLAIALVSARRAASSFALVPAGAGGGSGEDDTGGGTGEGSADGRGWLARLLSPGADVPYGVAIAVGALIALPGAPVAHALHGF